MRRALLALLLIAIILGGSLVPAFFANPIINGLILFVLSIGIVFSFIQVLRLYPEVRWVNSFQIGDRTADIGRPPVLLAPMANQRLTPKQGQRLQARQTNTDAGTINGRRQLGHIQRRLLVDLGVLLSA